MYKPERIVSLILFLFVFAVYAISCARTITFWDGPEFVTSSYNLQVTHPPGSPLYTMISSVILQFFAVKNIAFAANLISSFFGAITVTILFKITYLIALKIEKNKFSSKTNYLALVSGIASALTLAFSTSFWTASTEAEVYTLSFTLMTSMIYIMLKWEQAKDYKTEIKLLLLFSFTLGLATVVHLITISILIPLTLLFTHKKYGLSLKNIVLSLFIGCCLFFATYFVVMHGIIKFANTIDIWLVNSQNAMLNTGIIICIVCIAAIFSFILWVTHKKKNTILHHISLSLVFFLIGFSAYLMPIQRSKTSTSFTNNVENSNRMLQYVKGEQFGIGSIPLFKGPTFNAPLDKDIPFLDEKPTYNYNKITKQYDVIDDGKYKTVNYADEFSMYFPRLYDLGNAQKYPAWTTIKGQPIDYPVQGKNTTIYKPTFKENLGFFINYQVVWLNLRYLFWNFIGKQNNNQGLGYVMDGNWVSGFNFIDKSMVGNQSVMPEYYKNDKSKNTYYFLPFMLGLLGLWALRKHKQFLLTTIFIFLAFGLGITIYINPLPSSILVRERDYIFLGSFIIFSLWVGLSLIQIFKYLRFLKNKKAKLIIATLIVCICSPLQLLAKGWNDHQRSHDTFAYNFAKAYLDSCQKQSILITNGDNMTFPIWYLQEVEKYRTDVRVLNFDQLNLESQINQLSKKIYDSNPLKITLDKSFYANGVDKLIPLNEETNTPAKLPVLFEFLKDSKTTINWNGRLRHYIPSTNFSLPIDSIKSKKLGLYADKFNAKFIDEITWSYPKKFYSINAIVVMNIILNNIDNRPINFAINGKQSHYIGLQNYFVQNGMVETLAPIQRLNKQLNPKIVNTEMMFPFVLNTLNFKGLNDDSKYISPENKTYIQSILRRNYYFLAQALIEENKIKEAKVILDKCFTLFPNNTISYRQYAFALGKLYNRLGENEKSIEICKIAMQNVWDELHWTTSFNTMYPIINVRHAEKLKNMYDQMLNQYPGNVEKLKIKKSDTEAFNKRYSIWKKRNWPY